MLLEKEHVMENVTGYKITSTQDDRKVIEGIFTDLSTACKIARQLPVTDDIQTTHVLIEGLSGEIPFYDYEAKSGAYSKRNVSVHNVPIDLDLRGFLGEDNEYYSELIRLNDNE